MNTGETDAAEPDVLLIDNDYLLQKQPGKGGWTYAVISGVPRDRRARFGWVKVKGFIDSYALTGYRLMPMGKGKLFLPVKSEIRKKIGKQGGDFVRLRLYADDSRVEVPDELIRCLADHPPAYERFQQRSEAEQQGFVDWIYSAKTDETKVERIVKTIERLERGK